MMKLFSFVIGPLFILLGLSFPDYAAAAYGGAYASILGGLIVIGWDFAAKKHKEDMENNGT